MLPMPRDLTGHVLAITGASSGIGAALAEAAAQAGARLALCARRTDAMQALVARLGGDHLVLTCDVSDPEQCAQFIAATRQRFGRIDTLVCNAGYGLHQPVAQTTTAQWEAIWRTNVLGTTACIAAAVPDLLTQPLRDGWRAQVMIVSSCLARSGKPFAAAYSATKAAQLSVAEGLRGELRGQGVAVTSVHPVGTASEFDQAAGRAGGGPWRRLRSEPRQTPEQVAAAMLAAIRRPRAEVWPKRGSRLAFLIAATSPALAGWVFARGSRQALPKV